MMLEHIPNVMKTRALYTLNRKQKSGFLGALRVRHFALGRRFFGLAAARAEMCIFNRGFGGRFFGLANPLSI
jgi:hypothetical protein